MKKVILFLITISLLTLSCKKSQDATPVNPVNDAFDISTATLLRQGTLSGSGGYSVTGSAKIYQSNGRMVLVLDPFNSSNGPDLKVYLSTNTSASSFVNLGKLKSTNGKQSYEIPANTNISQFKFALIWCQQFSVLFGNSETQ